MVLLVFYSWFYERGRHAHVWLLLASPTVKQIAFFKHTPTTYVFCKDHKYDVAALLGQVARVCSDSLMPVSPCLRLVNAS